MVDGLEYSLILFYSFLRDLFSLLTLYHYSYLFLQNGCCCISRCLRHCRRETTYSHDPGTNRCRGRSLYRWTMWKVGSRHYTLLEKSGQANSPKVSFTCIAAIRRRAQATSWFESQPLVRRTLLIWREGA